MTYIYAPSHQRAVAVAKELGLEWGTWQFIAGPDDIRASSFHLVHNAPLTMGMEYRLSVARASGGTVTVQEHLT